MRKSENQTCPAMSVMFWPPKPKLLEATVLHSLLNHYGTTVTLPNWRKWFSKASARPMPSRPMTRGRLSLRRFHGEVVHHKMVHLAVVDKPHAG